MHQGHGWLRGFFVCYTNGNRFINFIVSITVTFVRCFVQPVFHRRGKNELKQIKYGVFWNRIDLTDC